MYFALETPEYGVEVYNYHYSRWSGTTTKSIHGDKDTNFGRPTARWKPYRAYILAGMFGPQGSSDRFSKNQCRCVECFIFSGSVHINKEVHQFLDSNIALGINAASAALDLIPGSRGLEILENLLVLGNNLAQGLDGQVRIKTADRINITLGICADGRRLAAIYNLPFGGDPRKLTDTAQKATKKIGSVKSDPGGEANNIHAHGSNPGFWVKQS